MKVDEIKAMIDTILAAERVRRRDAPTLAEDDIYEQLCDAFKEGLIKSDLDFAEIVTGNREVTENSRQIKKRFTEHLLRCNVFVDLNKTRLPEYRKKTHKLAKRYTTYQVLLTNGYNECAETIIKQANAAATELANTPMILDTLYWLRSYAAKAGDDSAYQEYNKLAKHYSGVLQAEFEARGLLDWIQLKFRDTNVSTKEQVAYINSKLTEIEQIALNSSAPVLVQDIYQIKIRLAFLLNENDKVIFYTDRLLKWYAQHETIATGGKVATVFADKAVAHYARMESKAGIAAIEKALAKAEHWNGNYQQIVEFAFLLYMQSSDYEHAAKKLEYMLNRKKKGMLSSEQVQRWMVYEVFLRNANSKACNFRSSFLSESRFSAERFLANVPYYQSDKLGFNVLILIAHVFLLLDEMAYSKSMYRSGNALDGLLARVRTFELYINQYLRHYEMYRSQCVMRTFIEVIKNHCDFGTAVQIVNKYKSKLQKYKGNFEFDLRSIEPIPFPRLLDVLLERIKIINDRELLVKPIYKDRFSKYTTGEFASVVIA